jgi:Ca2+-binding EF-hand superfamily protein
MQGGNELPDFIDKDAEIKEAFKIFDKDNNNSISGI